MIRKRAAILQAAQNAFLDTGYDGSSMESIAKTADVSIMTLYRHARSEDELFAAVTACEPVDSAELAKLEAIMKLPQPEAIFQSALHMQQTLLREDSIALMSLAISEATRFPRLAELAYAGFTHRLVDVTTWILSEIAPESGLNVETRPTLARIFVDRIVGMDLIRSLLCLSAPSIEDLQSRALPRVMLQ